MENTSETNKERVVAAMSGGVDSSVAAALLKERGYEVIGVSMQLYDFSKLEDEGGATEGSCCSLDDLYDARRAADSIGIPYYVFNMEEDFSREVVDYFVEGYLRGETPNPCTRCNQVMKFELLLRKAKELGAAYVATGHYARIEEDNGRFALLKGRDPDKDQSYFLFTMTQDELRSVLFPVGEMTKEEVREYAREKGLKVAEKNESQEICFITGSGYGDFIAQRAAAADAAIGSFSMMEAGDMVDRSDKVVGNHRGLFRYTIGQRKGLNIGGPGGPYYVVDIDLANNRLVVGSEEDLLCTGLVAREVSWIGRVPNVGEEFLAKIRYRHRGVRAEVMALNKDNTMELRFMEPEKAVTPGQAVVLYEGDEVLGGGWIERAVR